MQIAEFTATKGPQSVLALTCGVGIRRGEKEKKKKQFLREPAEMLSPGHRTQLRKVQLADLGIQVLLRGCCSDSPEAAALLRAQPAPLKRPPRVVGTQPGSSAALPLRLTPHVPAENKHTRTWPQQLGTRRVQKVPERCLPPLFGFFFLASAHISPWGSRVIGNVCNIIRAKAIALTCLRRSPPTY